MSEHTWITAAAAALGAALLAAAPAAASLRIEKHLDLAPGGRLSVTSEIGSLTLRGDATTGAAILITGNADDFEKRYVVTFDTLPGEVHVTIKHRPEMSHWWTVSNQHVKLAISVPRATSSHVQLSGGDIDAADLEGDTDLHSSGGSIDARTVAGRLTAHSSGGDVAAQQVRGTAELSSSGGSIKLDRATGDVHASSSGGDVSVVGAGGRVVAGSSGGSVHVTFAPGNSHGGEVKSSGGDVEVHVDRTARLNVEAAASGGDVTCDLPLTVQGRISSHRVSGSIQGGGALLTVHSSGGGVTIAAL